MQEPSLPVGPLRTVSAATREPADQPLGDSALLADVIENAPVLIIIADHQGRIRLFNQTCKDVTGWRRETIIGRPLLDVLGTSEARCLCADQFRRAVATRFRPPITVTSPLVTSLGECRQIRWTFSASGQRLAAVDGVLGIGVEVTERLAAENHARRRHADLIRHMYDDMLTAFATTLSHEVSQPLSAVLAYLQGSLRLLAQEAAASDEIAAYVDKAAVQARRAGNLARSMRSRNRNQVPAADPVDVNSVLAGVVALTEADLLAEGITVDLDLAPGLPRISMPPRALELMMFTLIQTILGAVAQTEAGSGLLWLVTRRSDKPGVEIALTLNGLDSSPVPAFRAFAGRGLDSIALGFSMCRSVLRDYGGDLELKEPASGITFVAGLPEAVKEGADD